jgi:hypothetical protein
MRSRFDEQLALLNRELIEMGALCEEVIAAAAKALMEGDTELAAQIPPRASGIDQQGFIRMTQGKAGIIALGNRRFLCFHVDSMEFIKINYAQLYAQIKYLLNKPGYQYWFTQSENSRIEENNEDFIFHSPEEELVLTHIRKPERFEKVHYLTVTEIAELIRERTGYQYSHGTKAQLGKVMSKHGFEFHKGKNGRRYTVFIIDTEQVKSNRLYE